MLRKQERERYLIDTTLTLTNGPVIAMRHTGITHIMWYARHHRLARAREDTLSISIVATG